MVKIKNSLQNSIVLSHHKNTGIFDANQLIASI